MKVQQRPAIAPAGKEENCRHRFGAVGVPPDQRRRQPHRIRPGSTEAMRSARSPGSPSDLGRLCSAPQMPSARSIPVRPDRSRSCGTTISALLDSQHPAVAGAVEGGGSRKPIHSRREHRECGRRRRTERAINPGTRSRQYEPRWPGTTRGTVDGSQRSAAGCHRFRAATEGYRRKTGATRPESKISHCGASTRDLNRVDSQGPVFKTRKGRVAGSAGAASARNRTGLGLSKRQEAAGCRSFSLEIQKPRAAARSTVRQTCVPSA